MSDYELEHFTELVADLDREFGRRMKQRRESRQMSQQQLATALHQYGFTWHQTTVGKTETGERPIKLSEALAVAIALGYGPNLDELIHDDTSGARHLERLTAAQDEAMLFFNWVMDRTQKLGDEIEAVEAKIAEREGRDGEHREEA